MQNNRTPPTADMLHGFGGYLGPKALEHTKACNGQGPCVQAAKHCAMHCKVGRDAIDVKHVKGNKCMACGYCCFFVHAYKLQDEADGISPEAWISSSAQMQLTPALAASPMSRSPSPEMPTLRFKMQRERSPTPPMTSTAAILAQAPPPFAQKRMRLWEPSPPASPSSENCPPALEMEVRTAKPIFPKGLPAPAVNHGISNRSWADRPPPPPPPPIELPPIPSPQEASAEDANKLAPIEKIRLANIARNHALMVSLGIVKPISEAESAANSAAKPRRKYNKIPKGRPAERDKSERTAGKVVNYKDPDENDVHRPRSESPAASPVLGLTALEHEAAKAFLAPDGC